MQPTCYGHRMRLTRDTVALGMLATAETIVWAGLFYLFPIFLLRWEVDLGWPRSDVALAFTLALAVSALASPLFGRLIDMGLSRFTLPATAAGGGVLLFALSMAETQMAFFLIWALIGFCTAGCLYEPCFAFLTRVKGINARGAITAVTLIAGFASTICYPIADALAAADGWRNAARWFAAAILLAGAPLFIISTRMLEAGATAPPPRAATSRSAAKTARRSPVFWYLATAFPLLALTHGMTISHIMPILGDRGATPTTAVWAASLIGPMQVLGRIAMITLGRNMSAVTITLISFAGIALSMFILLSASEGDWRIFAFVLLLGACYGVISITRPLVTADLLGREGFGAISGSLALPYVALLAAAPFVAVLLWRWGGYDLTIMVGAAAALAGAPLLIIAQRTALHRSQPSSNASTREISDDL